MATIREVSKHAGVSVATVSRVVNGNKWVSEATRLRVLESMEELGYEPNSFARSLATNRSNTIGMVVGDLSGPFFGPMMQRAEQVIRDAGKHLIITSGHSTLEEERDAVQFLLKRRCDALILHLDLMPDEEIIELCDKSPLPIILVNRLIPELADRCVSLDNEAGGYLATRHLLDLGHTRIAHITGPLYKSDARDRLAGYRRALETAGVPYDESLVVESDYLESGGAQALDRLKRREAEFTAVVGGNDLMAIGVINALRQQGVRVPEQCSVVGYDDVVMSAYFVPALTTVRVPVDDFGADAARLALKLCEGASDTAQLRFQPELVERQSTLAKGEVMAENLSLV
ncbi:LacI family DNA-binding transcriptional regulator [Saccharospirillum salsuginis]|uniref:Repressor n=1 Tax=Saccharospirillum salsuginis TaxID=418750 RepID=A0A918NJQ4_9GAMM|nr:LacI family DNA-binding transcriptional regulator [Saccharospirillum salsuginis]GGX72993.1 repressor [Saccharospirillum salsuginis]